MRWFNILKYLELGLAHTSPTHKELLKINMEIMNIPVVNQIKTWLENSQRKKESNMHP